MNRPFAASLLATAIVWAVPAQAQPSSYTETKSFSFENSEPLHRATLTKPEYHAGVYIPTSTGVFNDKFAGSIDAPAGGWTLSLPGFDARRGTLRSVTVSLVSLPSLSMLVNIWSPYPNNAIARIEATATANVAVSLGGSRIADSGLSVTARCSFAFFNSCNDLQAAPAGAFDATRQLDIGAFLGGPVTFDMTRDHRTSWDLAFLSAFDRTPVLATSQNLRWDGTLSVTYDYEAAAVAAVPEPASWATMIAGFALAGGALRRRRVLAA